MPQTLCPTLSWNSVAVCAGALSCKSRSPLLESIGPEDKFWKISPEIQAVIAVTQETPLDIYQFPQSLSPRLDVDASPTCDLVHVSFHVGLNM